MTEAEANTKWCPLERVPGYDFEGTYNGTSINRPEHTAPWPRCIGSACMMWRVRNPGLITADGQVAEEMTGYCGLAGKP